MVLALAQVAAVQPCSAVFRDDDDQSSLIKAHSGDKSDKQEKNRKELSPENRRENEKKINKNTKEIKRMERDGERKRTSSSQFLTR